MFTVNEFRWLTTNDTRILEFNNWSRPYEYAFTLNRIKSLSLQNPSIHNTCCGTGDIHLQFAKALDEISTNVTHSDMIISDLFAPLKNMIKYNLLEELDRQFDIVICVSSLEDAYDTSPENANVVFANMLKQVKPNGRLIITCDYPTVSLPWCEEKLGQKIVDSSPRLNSANSIYPRTDFAHYNIIAMDLIKK